MTLDKAYDPKNIEDRWYAHWENNRHFAPQGDGAPYCILLPPPNVTGTLHMGHAYQHTLMDALIRYHRMRGQKTLWQMGTDHAGIATEMVVTRNLERDGTTRDSIGRAAFIDKVWEWKQQSGDTIERQMRRLGASGDWSRRVFTMDPMAARAVTEAFVRWHEAGLIYRGQRLVNWDPVLKTAISDLEVASQEEDGHLWSIRYPLADGSGSVVVATTRPETMLGDTAVMVHPDDERYAHLIGKHVKLPLAGREIPVIADDYVDREFGTGVVKVTPAHDFNDYAVGQRHQLPLINIFTPEAAVNDNAPEKYRGLDRFAARKAVLADLEVAGLLVETKKHKLQVPRGDRSGQVIEPYLTDQWFVKMDSLAARGLELVESGAIKFVPGNWINTYRHWMQNIQDWCISRQLWWGHRIPAWYGADGRCFVGRDEAEARAKAKAQGYSGELTQDEDVLETWFSSQLWPISTMGWPDAAQMAERGFEHYVPTNVLVTGFDIIFFWVARMIMATDHFTGKIPFKEVYITGLVRDKDGQKMSKSKGNILDPLDLIDGITLDDLLDKRTSGLMQPKMAEKIAKATRKEFPEGIAAYGADALRFTITALASHTREINFDLGRLEGYRNFCNKLWNAARYVLMNTENQDNGLTGELELSLADRWIRSRLARTIDDVRMHFDSYRFDLAAKALYEFTWNEYCDWYLELSKPVLQNQAASAAQQRGTRNTLVGVLETLLRLLHPVIPFITEEIWQRVAPLADCASDSIMAQRFPYASDFRVATEDEEEMQWLMEFILGVRRIRGEMDIAPSRPLPVLIQDADSTARERLQTHAPLLTALARLESVTILDAGAQAPQSAVALLGAMKILVPMAGLIDKDAELARLTKLIGKAEADLARGHGKLANPAFVDKAPADIVNKERSRLAALEQELAQLQSQRERIAEL